MEIYGVGLIAFCMFIGSILGRILGSLTGVGGDVGGVGFSMLILMVFCSYMQKNNKKLSDASERGISFLSAIYIPVVVAMSANQNVVAAVNGGAVALGAGIIATVGSLMFIPLLSKLAKSDSN